MDRLRRPRSSSGHAEVIAQGLVDFPDGTFHWQVADGSLATGADPTAVPEAVTFVLADGGVVDVTGTVASYRLGAGEADDAPRILSEAVLSTAGDARRLLDVVDRQRRPDRRGGGDRWKLLPGPRRFTTSICSTTCWRPARP